MNPLDLHDEMEEKEARDQSELSRADDEREEHGPHECPCCNWLCTCSNQPCSCCEEKKLNKIIEQLNEPNFLPF